METTERKGLSVTPSQNEKLVAFYDNLGQEVKDFCEKMIEKNSFKHIRLLEYLANVWENENNISAKILREKKRVAEHAEKFGLEIPSLFTLKATVKKERVFLSKEEFLAKKQAQREEGKVKHHLIIGLILKETEKAIYGEFSYFGGNVPKMKKLWIPRSAIKSISLKDENCDDFAVLVEFWIVKEIMKKEKN